MGCILCTQNTEVLVCYAVVSKSRTVYYIHTTGRYIHCKIRINKSKTSRIIAGDFANALIFTE